MLEEGDKAPDFVLPADGGRTASLSALRGSLAVVYFYPKDNTEGCTLEAREFDVLGADFSKAGAQVVGISPDSPKSHDRFKAKQALDLTLASDEQRSVAEAYGVWVEKSMYGRTFMGVERATFLIDRKGRIARIWRKVRPKGHAAEVLEVVRSLNK